MSRLSNIIFLEYNEDRKKKTGIINVRFKHNVGSNRVSYSGIDYSGYDIQKYVERNSAVLHKIEDLMNLS